VSHRKKGWSNPCCTKCGALTNWNKGADVAPRAEAKLCPECYSVKVQTETLGPEALIECMTCDEHAVLRVEQPEFDCKPCREKRPPLPVTRGAWNRRGANFDVFDATGRN
jgi:hypothetical protein